MAHYSNESVLTKALIALCLETGARCGILQAGTTVIEHNHLLPESSVKELSRSVDEMLGAYEAVGRNVETAFFAFSDSILVVVSGGTLRATLSFARSYDRVNAAIQACKEFLRVNRGNLLVAGCSAIRETGETLPDPRLLATPESPAPESAVWPDFRPKLKAVLSRVINSAQADRVIDDAIKALCGSGTPPNREIRNLSREVINQVPHSGKRGALLAEISDTIDDYNLP